MLSALSSHWLYRSLGLGITTKAETITNREVAANKPVAVTRAMLNALRMKVITG